MLEMDKSKNLRHKDYVLIRNSFFDFIKIHENLINYKDTQYHILETLCDLATRIQKIDPERSKQFDQYFALKEKYEDQELFCLPHKLFTGYIDKASFEVYDAMDYRLLSDEETKKVDSGESKPQTNL